VPAFTFFATAGAVSRVGARPVFADIDPVSYNLAPSEIDRLSTPRTKAVIPVHLFGQCAEMESILAASRRHHLHIVEDAAQSIGARYQGLRVGQLGGDIVTFSFYPTKNLGAMGDGGMCVTNDDELAERLFILRNHGAKPKYYNRLVGMNSRLDALQAAALSVKLKYLEQWHESRRRNAACYDKLLADIPGIETPRIAPHCESIYNQYTIRLKDGKRDGVRGGLKERGIGTELYYPLSLHLQECYRELGGEPGDLPHTELACREALSIPIYPELTATQQEEVAEALGELIQSVPATPLEAQA